jgi:hypothetical protein
LRDAPATRRSGRGTCRQPALAVDSCEGLSRVRGHRYSRAVGNIGITEILILLIVVFAVPAGIVALLRRSRRPSDLVECRTCRRMVSPRAETCPQCGEPRAPLRG